MCHITTRLYTCGHTLEDSSPTRDSCLYRRCASSTISHHRKDHTCPSCRDAEKRQQSHDHLKSRRDSIFPTGHDAFMGQPQGPGEELRWRENQRIAYRRLQDRELEEARTRYRDPAEVRKANAENEWYSEREKENHRDYQAQAKSRKERIHKWQADVSRRWEGRYVN